MQPNGVFYMAVDTPLEKSQRLAINKFLDELIHNFPAENETDLEVYARATEPLLPWSKTYNIDNTNNTDNIDNTAPP